MIGDKICYVSRVLKDVYFSSEYAETFFSTRFGSLGLRNCNKKFASVLCLLLIMLMYPKVIDLFFPKYDILMYIEASN